MDDFRIRLMKMLTGSGGGRLPAEYQEVEWIANGQGTGAIPLSVYPSYSVGIRAIFGRSALATNTSTEIVYSRKDSGATRWGVGTDGERTIVGQFRETYHRYSIDAKYVKNDYVDFNFLDSKQLRFNVGVLAQIPSQTSFSSYPLVSGGRYDDSGNISYLDGIPPLSELLLSDGDAIVSDLIPCYRKSDNNAGFYDILNSEYLPSVGTDFEFGPDVI